MINGKTLRDAIISGANNIACHRAEVDELNVFPVPDGDTGVNMSMTCGAARDELLNMPDSCTVAEASKVAAAAMLRGARGNSGVITSLLFRGFSKALDGKKTADAADVVAAFKRGVEAAYKAVMKPTEGTMLTVARVAGEKAEASGLTDVTELWALIVDAAQKALEETPNQLEVLKKAGVVDAGGQGFCYILEGMQSVIAGGEIIPSDAPAEPKKKAKLSTANVGKGVFAQELNPDITNAYCTEFLVNKENGHSPEKLRAFLESNGDSVVLVDDDDIIKCHVHTANPGKILSEAVKFGYLTKIKIENMHEQYEERQAQGAGLEKQAKAEAEAPTAFPYAAVDPAQRYGFVAVAAGDGLRDVFTDLGVDAVVTGGQTMNPSTEDILSAIQSVPAQTVFVLPNNKNIIMAGEQAGKLADRDVVVLPTRTIPQGMSAMLAFDPEADSERNTIEMKQMAAGVETGLVTFAARNSNFDGKKIQQGEILGLANGKLSIVGSDITKTTYRLTRGMCKKDTSFVTLIYGADVTEEQAEHTAEMVRAKIPAGIEVTLIAGGQPVYYYMVSVE
ncbi:DAK2 domain-containing protein [Ruminococcaceae bacterium OttesenSCG-928-A11]|nr:DAK2 domain-containing protein [Ruminococcaceae bacterium OttesenSCG-928-A11]